MLQIQVVTENRACNNASLKNVMVSCDSVIAVYLSVSANFRGRMSFKEADE